MAKLILKREILKTAATRANLSDAGGTELRHRIEAGKGPMSLRLEELPMALLYTLLDDCRLTPNERAVIAMRVFGVADSARNDADRILGMSVSNPVEFGSAFGMLNDRSPNCEFFLNGRWYPIVLRPHFEKSLENHVTQAVALNAALSIADITDHLSYYVFPDLFLDSAGNPVSRTVLEVLQQFNLRRFETSSGEYNLRLIRAERASRETGAVVSVKGPVVWRPAQNWWPRLESRALGAPTQPRRCVVEPELEVDENRRGYFGPHAHNENGLSRLPFVRLFSLDIKSYVYADIDDIEPCAFDHEALDRLQLPTQMLGVLTKVFNTSMDGLFGDLIANKHGGVVVLAWGNPGVGKTLTAEVYAEHTQRPLYVLELGELGTHVGEVEEKLQRVFTRVARWNAVLQFDECEVFLARRGDDLERSAIVGGFLRLLDYYHGILFLTTNRPEVLDHAVLSRVMLKLHYPDLDRDARAAIWRTMFDAAGLTLTDASFAELAEEQVNGRNIRNLTRLTKILHPDGMVTLEQVRAVTAFAGTSDAAWATPDEAAERVGV